MRIRFGHCPILPRGLRTERPFAWPGLFRRHSRRGFTIIEVMIAIGIFMMVIAAIYSTWMAILRGSKAGLEAAANAQRARIAMRTVQDALLTAVNFPENGKWYSFLADSSGDYASIEFSARLPSSFPGVGRFSGNIMRRVRFAVEPSPNGKNELVMIQAPLLADPEKDFEPYRLVLSQDVTLFMVEFFDPVKREYSNEWKATNTLPRLVRMAIGMGRIPGTDAPRDLTSTSIALPATAMYRDTPTRPGPPITPPPP